MNKTELINKIQENTNGWNKKDCETALSAVINAIKKAVSEDGEKVKINDFGTFVAYIRKGRDGRNPATGEKIVIPDKRVVKFTPSKAFKDML